MEKENSVKWEVEIVEKDPGAGETFVIQVSRRFTLPSPEALWARKTISDRLEKCREEFTHSEPWQNVKNLDDVISATRAMIAELEAQKRNAEQQIRDGVISAKPNEEAEAVVSEAERRLGLLRTRLASAEKMLAEVKPAAATAWSKLWHRQMTAMVNGADVYIQEAHIWAAALLDDALAKLVRHTAVKDLLTASRMGPSAFTTERMPGTDWQPATD